MREVEEGIIRREVVAVVDACEVVEIGVLKEGVAVEGEHARVQQGECEQAG